MAHMNISGLRQGRKKNGSKEKKKFSEDFND